MVARYVIITIPHTSLLAYVDSTKVPDEALTHANFSKQLIDALRAPLSCSFEIESGLRCEESQPLHVHVNVVGGTVEEATKK